MQLTQVYPGDLGPFELKHFGKAINAIEGVLPFGGYVSLETCRNAVRADTSIPREFVERLTMAAMNQMRAGMGTAMLNEVPGGPYEHDTILHVQR